MKKPESSETIQAAYATLNIERRAFIDDVSAAAGGFGLSRFTRERAPLERLVDETVVRLSDPMVSGRLAERQPLVIGSMKNTGAFGMRLNNALRSNVAAASQTDTLPLRGLTSWNFKELEPFPNLGGISAVELAIIRQADIATSGFTTVRPAVAAAPVPLTVRKEAELSHSQRSDALRRIRRLLGDDKFLSAVDDLARKYEAEAPSREQAQLRTPRRKPFGTDSKP